MARAWSCWSCRREVHLLSREKGNGGGVSFAMASFGLDLAGERGLAVKAVLIVLVGGHAHGLR